MNRPTYVGFTVLDLSKTLMYHFHYSYILQRYQNSNKLLFTDTDSLCYEIHTEDIYKDMQQDSNHFDFSDYPTDHPLYSIKNKKVIGKMKDETSSIPISEYCGLRAKMYSMTSGGKEKKTTKGISRSAAKNLVHQMYKDALFNRQSTKTRVKMIRSIYHEIYSMEQA